MYKAREMKLGRIFEVNFDPGDDYMAELTAFVKKENIRRGSIFLLGALAETDMISGFNSMEGYDVARHHFDGWRELVAYGNISWWDKPPAALGEGVEWDEPQPYIHIHMAISGGPGDSTTPLVGHLSDAKLKGDMATHVYELV